MTALDLDAIEAAAEGGSYDYASTLALVARVRELEEQCDAHHNDRRAWNRQLDGFIAAVMRLEGERDEAIAREALSAQAICGMADHATVREARVRELEAERDEALADAMTVAERLSERLGAERGIRFRMVDRLTTERDEARASVTALRNNLAVAGMYADAASERDAKVEAERDALLAIIEGRAVAPTDAELDAHVMAGGWWMYCDGELPRTGWFDPHSVHVILRYATRWWPLDASGRPCPWPVTT